MKRNETTRSRKSLRYPMTHGRGDLQKQRDENTKHNTERQEGGEGKIEENRETHVSIVTALFGTVLTRFTDSPR